MIAPASSSSTTGSSGLRVWRMKCHHEFLPFSGADCLRAVRKLALSSTSDTPRIPIATQAETISSGNRILWIASLIANSDPMTNRTSATTNE